MVLRVFNSGQDRKENGSRAYPTIRLGKLRYTLENLSGWSATGLETIADQMSATLPPGSKRAG